MATPLPNSHVLRAAPDSVTPLQPDVKIAPDGKGSGAYTSTPAQLPASATANPNAPLTVLVPASFTTNAATLSASSMFAAQLLSQDGKSGGVLAAYEAMAQAAAVKYKPSNATMPQPEANNLFARMLAETKGQPVQQKTEAPAQALAKEVASQPAAQAQATVSKPVRSKSQAPIAAVRQANTAYQTTAIRNEHLLDEESQIEPLVG